MRCVNVVQPFQWLPMEKIYKLHTCSTDHKSIWARLINACETYKFVYNVHKSTYICTIYGSNWLCTILKLFTIHAIRLPFIVWSHFVQQHYLVLCVIWRSLLILFVRGPSWFIRGKLNVHHAHIQSMHWAMDRQGLAAIQKAGAIYDCEDQLSTRNGWDQLIIKYVLGLFRAVMMEGYSIQDMTDRAFHWAEAQNASCSDMWNNTNLVKK